MNVVRKLDSPAGEDAENEGPDHETGAAQPTLSIDDVARALRVSAATVRRYLADHGQHVVTVRNGRSLRVELGSFPALARIRDLRRRKLSRDEIDRLLERPMEETVVGGSGAAESPEAAQEDLQRLESAFEELRRDFSKVKQELRDNELVVRQSFSTILFLVEKYTKEIEYHTSEERIANRERDLRLAYDNARGGSGRQRRKRGILSSLASLFATPSSSR